MRIQAPIDPRPSIPYNPHRGETVLTTIEIPEEVARFELPDAVQDRLQHLLDKQDAGDTLTPAERKEAEGLVELAEFLSYLRLNARRMRRHS